ncbi:SSU ribosomal protein S6P [Magnetococcus marinus MC-1]|uniref:Small ribosomal subunit protein bS6 n=1 Tax=Magnetococcus marinus (strain ATCC BAA-1437 / JCM 17883 / MC-1) TaxID=156889 RepID=RS6_MAGMM|nr:30S ribosomal protein S6 [Magnetococcus marinus]A0LAG9.1 RecName: Full=Small ribosomal subunit protein bS6; AltName: Full=30S ribosomal protein S6 [Magnetococcus marinus MC-1]ABK44962.1 SSU ribosomal protein S6P [Magnetococcus marinus MC-1]
MAFYESIYILRADLTTEQVELVNKRFSDNVAATGGKVVRTELWGRRQLAYLVKKNVKGFYVFHILEGEGSMVHDLEAKLGIDEDVLKFQHVRIEDVSDKASPLAPCEEKGEEGKAEDAADELTTFGMADDDDLGDDDDTVEAGI